MPTGTYKRLPRGEYGCKVFSKKKQEFIKKNCQQLTVFELAKKLRCSYNRLSGFMSRNNIPRKRSRRHFGKTIVEKKVSAPVISINRAAFTKYSNQQYI